MDESIQSANDHPQTDSAANETPGMPKVRERRVLSWDEWMELMSHYRENRCGFPSDQLLALVGKTIAWEPDGLAIRETGADYREVVDKIKAQGDDASIYVYEDIPVI